jgi:uncharacterized protein YndB with AHSA1/START domain
MLKKILIGVPIALAVIVLVFVGIVAMQPAEFVVVRKVAIAAPPEAVFAKVNDFHNWDAWSPWAKLDPAMKTTFEGPSEGKGAIYTWTGNDKVGEGRMTILESHPSSLVDIKLEFLKPFESLCTTKFSFEPSGDKTNVTWSMAGKNNFIAKAMSLFINMDSMLGGDFERGLAQMKTLVEGDKKDK